MECYRSKAASEQWNDGSAGISSYCCCCVGSARKSSTRFHVSCTCWIFRFLFKLHAEYPASGLARWRRDGEEQDQTLLYLCRNQYSLWRESSHFGGKSKQRFTSSNLWMVCGVCGAYVLLCPSALSAQGCCVMPHRPLKFPCTVIRH